MKIVEKSNNNKKQKSHIDGFHHSFQLDSVRYGTERYASILTCGIRLVLLWLCKSVSEGKNTNPDDDENGYANNDNNNNKWNGWNLNPDSERFTLELKHLVDKVRKTNEWKKRGVKGDKW